MVSEDSNTHERQGLAFRVNQNQTIDGRLLRDGESVYVLVDPVDDGYGTMVAGPSLQSSLVKPGNPVYELVDAIEEGMVEKKVSEIAEKIAREIIPDIAEKVIREEIEKLKRAV